MADLHPTKARLAFLAAIEGREVTGYPYYGSGHVDYFLGSGHGRRVTARVIELIRAGWVPEYKPEGKRRPDFRAELTDEGRRVLEASRG